jgi:UDP-glucose 6-dehydrogenase
MKIAITGHGYVGKATEIMLKKYFHPLTSIGIQDKTSGATIDNWSEYDYHMICVNTPSVNDNDPESALVIQNVLDAYEHAINSGFKGHTVIRSTISVTDYDVICDIWNIIPISWPEFLRQAHWEEDAYEPRLLVMSGPGADELSDAMDACSITIVPDPRAAWYMKLARNAFYAMKVIVANDLKRGADAMNIDYEQVKAAIKFDPYIGQSHWDQPGDDGKMGFGGVCLPKDTKSLANEMRNVGLHDTFSEWTVKKNLLLR